MSPTAFFFVLCVVAASAQLELENTLNVTAEVTNLFASLRTTVDGLSKDILNLLNDVDFLTRDFTMFGKWSSSTFESGVKVYEYKEYSVTFVYISNTSARSGVNMIPTSCDSSEKCQNVIDYLNGNQFQFWNGRNYIDTTDVIVLMGNNYVFYTLNATPYGITY